MVVVNDFTSNITRKLARVFLEKFESARVLSKNVNTQMLEGKFGPSTGSIVDFKRPTDYRSVETSDGDLTSETENNIITGKASGVVRDYITVEVAFGEVEQSLEMDQIDQLLEPMATRIVTTLETNFARFMMVNSNLAVGDPDTPVTGWASVAKAGALMTSTGVPKDMRWNYAVNPFTQVALADAQRTVATVGAGTGSGGGGAMGTATLSAHKEAIITENYAGMRVSEATTMDTYALPSVISPSQIVGTPTNTYVAHKDTFQQLVTINGLTDTQIIAAGTVIQFDTTERLNLSTRKLIIDNVGGNVQFTAIVAEDAEVGVGGGALTGEANLTLSGFAINEAGGLGQYDTVNTLLANSNGVTILGTIDTVYQPNLFWHPNAFGIGSDPIAKLFSTDTLAKTEDGLQIRVSKGATIRANKQIVRFDLHPAFAAFNPFMAGHGYG